jgi:hypothetical protein
MAEKPVAERLQVKGGRRLAVVGAPAGLETLIGVREQCAELPEAEVVLLFVRDFAALDAQLTAMLPLLRPAAILWIAYPKLTSKLTGELSRDALRAAMPRYGLDTVSQIAIDDDWSALRMKRLP